jgi:outer membrane biogenesis lipoprotein LolB
VKLLGAVALLLLAGCTSGAEQRQPSGVASWRPIAGWSGKGSAQLGTFPTGGASLRFHWESNSSDLFKIHLHSADSGRTLAEIAERPSPGAQSVEIADDHQRFYLTIESSDSEWTIRVEEAVMRPR